MTGLRVDSFPEIVAADVAVIGAGPGGIAAAVSAAERGLRVVVVDRGLEAGGQIWRRKAGAAAAPEAQPWLTRLADSSARTINGASVVDVRPDAGGFEILVESSGRPLRIWAADIVLATGARELFIPFDGWTLPGVMGIGGTQALLKSGASFAGKRVVIAGSGPLMLPVAASLADAGAKLLLVAEQAGRAAVARFASGLWKTPGLLLQAAKYRVRFLSARYATGTWVTAAQGGDRLESISITDGHHTWREDLDVLCTGYGLIPNVEIARLIGCEIRDGAIAVDNRQRTNVNHVLAVGEATGIGGAPLSLIEGSIAGSTVGSVETASGHLSRRRASLVEAADRMLEVFAPRAELRSLPHADTIVCRCEDVTYGAIQGAACARQAKLYTRVGMGPCQGRTCMPSLDFLLAWQADTVRPPVEPALVSVLSSEVADEAASLFPLTSSVGEAYQ
ncbi:MAG: FAD/NAD(P)-binding oxidoreductase [Gemmatimonadaceae bacterium]